MMTEEQPKEIVWTCTVKADNREALIRALQYIGTNAGGKFDNVPLGHWEREETGYEFAAGYSDTEETVDLQ
jgi:hypothetical protein